MSTSPSDPDDVERDAPPAWLAEALDSVAPQPSEALRARLRASFVEPAASLETPPSTSSPARARAPRQRVPPKSVRASRSVLWVGALALAAAAVLAIVVLAPRASPRLEWVESELAAVSIDGIAPSAQQLEAQWLAGAELHVGAAPVRVRLDGLVLLEFAAGARARLEPWPVDRPGEAVVRLASGGVRVLTAPGFAPRSLRVLAPDAEVAVVGTEFGVDVLEGMGTCVCCTHGAVSVLPRGRERADTVLAGGMSFCFASGEAPMLGEAKADHASEITVLRRFGWRTPTR